MRHSACRRVLHGAVAALLFGAGTAALAQDIPDEDFTTFNDRLDTGPIAVTDRRQPPFEPIGVRAGNFLLFPELEIGGLYNSNLFATPDNEIDDVGVLLAPRISASTDWASGSLTAYARSLIQAYASNETESTEQIWAGINGQIDFRRNTEIRVAAEYGRFVEDRGSNFAPIDTRKPVEFDRFFGSVLFDTQSGRLRTQLRTDISRFTYDNARRRSDPTQIFVLTGRDYTRVEPQVRVGYDFTPDTQLFFGGAYNQRRYDEIITVDRDSDGGYLYLGFRLRPTPLIRVRAAVGYIWQRYKQPLGDASGLYTDLELMWFPTELTTVTAQLTRDVSESGAIVTGGPIQTEASLRVDHELLRNLILTGEARYQNSDFETIDREDRRYELAGSARYRLSPTLEVNGRLSYLKQDSRGPLSVFDFDQARFIVSATLKR